MPSRTLILTNKRGLHARAATRLVQCCQPFTATVKILHNDREADAANIMSLLMLAAPYSSELTIHAEGEDAEAALDALGELFAAKFGEEE